MNRVFKAFWLIAMLAPLSAAFAADPTAPVITNPPDAAAVIVEGQASDPFVPMWTASTDPDGDTLTYTWELWTPGPTTLLLSVATGTATQADLTMGAVAGLLAANGVAIGGNIDLVHRAVVNDGTTDVAGPTAAVNLTLTNLEPTPPAITNPPDGAAVTIQGQASDPFVPMWTASVDPEDDLVTYTWRLSTPAPSDTLLTLDTGTATQADLTMGAVRDLLDANGVNVGDSIALVHQAVADDGTTAVPGATADVTLTLANLEPTAPVITSPPDGASVIVEGQASDPFVPMWSASVDPEGSALEYTWELWTPGPTTLLLSVATGTATQADLTMGAVAGLLASNGVVIGGNIDLVHRAVVTDGTNAVAGPTAAVNLTLANLEPTPPVITSPPDGATVVIEGLPTDPFVPMWSASTDPEGDALQYTWELWTPGPTTLLLSVATGTATQADLTMGAVYDLLLANGVNLLESVDLVHRAVVTDGDNVVAGPTADVTLELGFVGYPVPTMGQLGLVIMVLLMALAGFAGYRRVHS